MPPYIMVSLHVAIAFFYFVFLWGEKINSGETTDVWNPATCIKKPLPTWCEEDNNIQFTLQVCVLWHFQFSVRFIYLYVIIHKGLPSLWMCGISLWWIMCTLQFMTNKSLVITQLRQHLRIHHSGPPLMVLNSHAEVQWYATNVHPMSIATTFLCVFFPTTPSIAYAQTIFLSVIIALHYFVFFVYFLNIYKLIQVTSSQETTSSYYHASK